MAASHQDDEEVFLCRSNTVGKRNERRKSSNAHQKHDREKRISPGEHRKRSKISIRDLEEYY